MWTEGSRWVLRLFDNNKEDGSATETENQEPSHDDCAYHEGSDRHDASARSESSDPQQSHTSRVVSGDDGRSHQLRRVPPTRALRPHNARRPLLKTPHADLLYRHRRAPLAARPPVAAAPTSAADVVAAGEQKHGREPHSRGETETLDRPELIPFGNFFVHIDAIY